MRWHIKVFEWENCSIWTRIVILSLITCYRSSRLLYIVTMRQYYMVLEGCRKQHSFKQQVMKPAWDGVLLYLSCLLDVYKRTKWKINTAWNCSLTDNINCAWIKADFWRCFLGGVFRFESLTSSSLKSWNFFYFCRQLYVSEFWSIKCF